VSILADGLVAPARPYGPLELGLTQALHVREERLNTGPNPSRLLYVSDIHLRRSRSDLLCQQILDAVTRCVPHAILLGGDLADQPSELDRLTDLVRQMNSTAPVLAVAGNHDRKVGIDRVCKAVTQGGGHWIHDRVALVTHRGRVIAVSGPESGGRDSAALVDGHVRVLCAHNPRIWKRARNAGFDLVLAGHLHGCQMVAFEYRDRLFPGALLYPYCYSSHRAGPTRLIVSRGVSDLVPIRWRCPREVVLCCV
jgi:predicted MPP superfamily phosphohydrolase